MPVSIGNFTTLPEIFGVIFDCLSATRYPVAESRPGWATLTDGLTTIVSIAGALRGTTNLW